MNDNTITIYNHKKAGKEDVWNKTILHGVSAVSGVDKSVSANGTVTRKQILNIVIPMNADAEEKEYIDPVQYGKLEDVSGFFTLDPSNNNDFIVVGECEEEITDQYHISDLKKDHAKCGIISGVSDLTDMPRLKHFKVVCRCG